MASADDKSYDDINVTPMVDLYLVLLLIFIIMTTAGVQGLKVDLPRASSKPATADMSAPKTQAVTIAPDGKIFLNTVPVTIQELESRLGAVKAATPDVPVVVRGDRASQYQGVMEVLDVLGRLQIDKIGLATQGAK
jgi:biopolymer transport protein ExbD